MFRWLVRLVVVKLVVYAGLAAVILAAARRFDRAVAADRRRLLQAPRPPHPPVVTEEMLAGLPEPARRYLRYAGVVGRPLVDTVRLRQRCRMRPGPGMPSFPLVAEQWYTVDPPGFIWDATVPVEGLPLVRGRDGYLEGRGVMTIRLGSLLPFVDASGPEMNEASLLRHLSEMTWFPSAFLRSNVTWEASDDSKVRVTLADGDRRATGVLEIDAEGRLVAFRAERHAMVGTGFEPRPWTAPTHEYGELAGLRLPVRGAAVWTLPDGSELEYITVELTELELDPPLPV